ncbi:MAG: glycosyltransferase [Flavobacteriales bacterium]|nr:glycosyltransferase [Flavobacteriales bacterium]
MKIFVLLSRVPWPLEKGDKLRAYHQVRQLSQHHHVILCCLNEGRLHPDAIRELQAIAAEVHVVPLRKWKIGLRMCWALWSDLPFQLHYFLQGSARRRVHQLIADAQPDHCYAQLIRTTEYVKDLHHLRKTLDYMDTFSAGQERKASRSGFPLSWFSRIEGARLKRYENLIFDYFDHHTIISAQDRDLIRHPMREKIEVVPNGVDFGFFTSDERPRHIDLLFTGNMSYAPNIDCAEFLVREILPRVRKQLPDTNLTICGATPHRRVLQLKGNGVAVLGWVDDIRSIYASARVFAAPMQIGTGMQNKLLEAMSMSLPCVSSPLACGGLGIEPGREVLSGINADEIAVHIITLLEDAALRKRIGDDARKFVQERYDWKTTTLRLENLILKTS